MGEHREEPPKSLEDLREILLQQLGYYRASLLAKLDGLTDDQLTASVLPSGWSPLGLLKHLVFVERRWMQWGFAAEQIPDPWEITIQSRRGGCLSLMTPSSRSPSGWKRSPPERMRLPARRS